MFHSRPAVLFLGDLFAFASALWLTLFLRTFDAPTFEVFYQHLVPFSLLFVIWVAVFMIAGLYESRSVIFARRAISATLLIAQTINISIAALFFFFVPFFGIAPKTILLIYLVISFLITLLWRVVLFPLLGLQKVENAIVVGSGAEIDSLVHALRRAHRAPARVAVVIPAETPELSEAIKTAVRANNARFVIVDFSHKKVSEAFPEVYNFLSQGVRFFDALTLHEQVFGRVPLSQIDERWLAENVSLYATTWYDPIKSFVDVLGGILCGVLSLPFYPFIMLAIKLEGGGPIFISQERVGHTNKLVRIYKFRTMSGNDNGVYGALGKTILTVTKVGKFLRAWRLDELPQFWNVITGDISLVGPRLELPKLVHQYEAQIPFYGVRHIIRPGLFGWAQLYYHGDPHHAADVEATKMKLSYDLYYLKHRSLLLDILIMLKTVRRLLVKSNA